MTNIEFITYCKAGNIEKVKLGLLDPNVDPYKSAAISWASENGHLEIVKLLLADKRVDPSADNNTAIRWASEKGQLEIVKLLLADKRVTQKALKLNQEEFYPSEIKDMYIF